MAEEYQPGKMDVQKIIQEYPCHIEVSKNAKGNYQYSVSYHGKDPLECLDTVKNVIEELEILYGEKRSEHAVDRTIQT